MIEKTAGHGEKRSRKEDLAVIALLSEPTIGKAAKRVGVSEATLWRWMQDESFQELYREARNKAVGQAIARLQQATTKAVNTLEAVISDSKAPANVKVNAARIIIETALRAIEIEDIQARLDRLERKARK